MSDNINIQSQSTDPPAEPLTREEQYLSAIAGVTPSSDIPEKPLTRIEKYLNKIVENGGGGGGTSDYDDLDNRPQINSHTLTGNMSSSDLGLQSDVMTGYEEPSETGAIAETDTVLEAMGKLEKKADDNQSNISSINTALNPTGYTTVEVYTGRDITITFGGYIKIGKLVIVTLRCTINTAVVANNAIFSGLPIPLGSSSLSAGAFAISLQNNQKVNIGITVEGNISTTENVSTGNLVITGCYISAN